MQSCWLWLRDAGVTSGKCCSTKRAQCSTLCKTFKNIPPRAEKQPPQVKVLKHAKVYYFQYYFFYYVLLIVFCLFVLKQVQLDFLVHQDSQCSITSIRPLSTTLPKPDEIQRKFFSGWESKSFFTLLPIVQCTWRQPQETPAQRSTQRLSETPPRVLCSPVMLIWKAALSGEVKLHASNKQNQKPTYHKNHF